MTKKRKVAQAKVNKVDVKDIPTKEDFLEKLFKPDMKFIVDKKIKDLQKAGGFIDTRKLVQSIYLFDVRNENEEIELYKLTIDAVDFAVKYLEGVKEEIDDFTLDKIETIKNPSEYFIKTEAADMKNTSIKDYKLNLVQRLIEEEMHSDMFVKLLTSAKKQLAECRDPKEIVNAINDK